MRARTFRPRPNGDVNTRHRHWSGSSTSMSSFFLLLLGGDACGASLLARDALRLVPSGERQRPLAGLFCLLFFAFRELFLAAWHCFSARFSAVLLLVLCGFRPRARQCVRHAGPHRLCLGSGGRSGRRSLALGFRRSLYRRAARAPVSAGGTGCRLDWLYRLCCAQARPWVRQGLGPTTSAMIDSRSKFTGIRNVVQQILELVQIQIHLSLSMM